MPVGSNEVRVDPRTGFVAQVEVQPGKIEGTYVLASDPSTTAYLPVETVGGRTLMPAAETKPTGEVYTRDGVEYTRMYGSQLGSNFIEDPVQGVVRFIPEDLAWLRGILGVWVGVLAATILVIATNAGLIGVSRLAYSLGQHRQVPPILGRVHPKRMTPYVSIIVFGVVACLIIIPGSTFFLADLYAFGAMISFTAAHISVVALRIKEPELRRPFRTPLSIPFRGKSLPLLSIIGGIGTFTVWCVVVATHAEGRLIGFAWMIAGFVVYVVYRKAKGYSLTKTVEKVVVPVSMQADIDYDQILVPVTGTRISDEMMVLACQLATEKKSSINGLYVIEVPLNLPLDASLVSERAKAERVLKAAAVIASQFKVKFTPHVVTTRQAGRAIVEEAVRLRSEVILVGTTRKRRIGNLIFGRTTDFVLDHAPCEVLLNLVPRDYPTEGSSSSDGSSGASSTSGTSAKD
jgi:APA family basic amino acid/polyamine antiporter